MDNHSRRTSIKTWPWSKSRTKKNIFGFNFHLYRHPYSYRCTNAMLDLLNDIERTTKPPFGKGITYAKWEYRIKSVCPRQKAFREWIDGVKDFFEEIPRRIRYWYITNIRDRIKPHNVIKINSLPRTYSDFDTKLEHVMFQILVDYFNSNPESTHNYEDCEHWKEFMVEAKFLLSWWNNRETWQSDWEKRLDVVYEKHPLDLKELTRLENEKNLEFEDKMIRLIKIRQGLWT